MVTGGGPARRLLAASAVVVMLIAPLPVASADAGRAGPLMLAGAALAAILACTGWSVVRSRRWTLSLLLFALFVAWSMLGTWWGMAPFHAGRRLATWLCGLTACAALAMAPDDGDDLRGYVRVLVVGVAAYAAYGLLAYAAAPRESVERLSSTFANADCFAALLLIGLGLACGLLADGRSLDTILGLVAATVTMAALALTGSRAGMLGAGVEAVTLALLVAPLRDGRRRLLRAAMPPLMILVLLAGGGALAGLGERWLLLLQGEGQQGIAVRRMVLEGALPTASRWPLAGAGPGNFAIAFLQSRPSGPFRGFINQAHIEPVQLLIETGLVGLLLFTACGLLAVRGAARSVRVLGAIPAGVAAALLGVGAYGLLNFALPVPADFVWISGTLGLACACDRLTHRKVARPGKVRRAAVLGALAAAVAIFVGLTGWRTWQGERLAREAALLGSQLRWEEADDALARALALQPGNERLYAMRAEFEQRRAIYEESDDLAQRALEDMRTALRLNPNAKALRPQAARFFRAAGRLDEAEAVLLQACAACPTDLGPRTDLALFYGDFGRYREAADNLWRVLPDLPEADRTLARLLINAELTGQGGAAALERWHRDRPQDERARAVGLMAAQEAVRTRDFDAAAALYATLTGWEDDNLCVRVGQAALETARGQRATARQVLEQGLQQAPPSQDCLSEAYMALADLYLADKEAPKAATLLERYVDLDPTSTTARMKLADAYLAADRQEAAVQVLQEALRRDPDNPAVQSRLHDLYRR